MLSTPPPAPLLRKERGAKPSSPPAALCFDFAQHDINYLFFLCHSREGGNPYLSLVKIRGEKHEWIPHQVRNDKLKCVFFFVMPAQAGIHSCRW
jgi:hypothetical protein